ncbi:hypothetical protein ANN_14572 [Periplaneta americana]|uniref:Uncharacterized protein n=1 Tax=Periplaneta americana TaxID=6978 RepID=A0ABQ8SWP3_PERAM|nr:hypothetical protein ANN_14572 [Periplaneta americana]
MFRCTRTLWFLVFTGAAIHFMVRMNMNIAIVAMVKKHYRNASVISNECITNESSEFKYEKTYSKDYFIGTNEYSDAHDQDKPLQTQSSVTDIEIIKQLYTTGVPQVGLLTIPAGYWKACNIEGIDHRTILIAIRLLQGILAGLSWPSLHNLTASWVPPKERSNFVTSYNGKLQNLISDTELKHIEQELGPTLALKKTGVLSGVPYICRVIFSYTFSLLADCLLKRCSVSHTRVRKIATFVCCIVQGIFIYGIALSGCDSIAAIVCITAATITNGASSSGPFASFVDLSPNFASK